MRRTDWGGIWLIAAAALLSASCTRGGSQAQRQNATETLTFSSKTSTLISGTYVLDGVTLGFSTTSSRTTLSNSAGQPILDYLQNADSTVTLSLMNGAATVTGWTDAGGNDQEIDSGDVDGQVNAVMARSDIQIAPYLSSALASAGVDGVTYPLSTNLHSLGRTLSLGTGVDPLTPTPTSSPMCAGDMMASAVPPPAELSTPGSTILLAARVGRAAPLLCQDLRNDPNCNNCLGMCGPGCTCWPWVCGDCCSHPGCVAHDLHCRACDRHHLRDCALCAVFDFGRPLFAC